MLRLISGGPPDAVGVFSSGEWLTSHTGLDEWKQVVDVSAGDPSEPMDLENTTLKVYARVAPLWDALPIAREELGTTIGFNRHR